MESAGIFLRENWQLIFTIATAVGAVIAGVQNTLRKQNVGAMGILTRSGGIIALFGASALNWRGWECWGAN